MLGDRLVPAREHRSRRPGGRRAGTGGRSPGTRDGRRRTDGWRAAQFDNLAPGPVEYAIVDDGTWRARPERRHDRLPRRARRSPGSTSPTATRPATTGADRHGERRGRHGGDRRDVPRDALGRRPRPDERDASRRCTARRPPTVTPSARPVDRGTIHLDLVGLPPGKSTLALHAKDVKGRAADAALATVWTEPQPFDWRDAIIYEVMVDRYRAQDGSPLAPPASMGGRAGGHVGGVTQAIESGELQALGVNTIWLTPLYANPDGTWPGLDGHAYSSYHGYWPSESRATGADDGRRARRRRARRGGARARACASSSTSCRTTCTPQHPYWLAQRERAAGSRTSTARASAASGSCSWATDETACWFTSYLPSLDWTDDAVAEHRRRATSRWWLDRFDGDGIRIDAVPMMPRAAIAAHRVGIARPSYDNPSHRTYVLGENYTGQGDLPSLRFYLGPHGLDSEFHFPLMWALRGGARRTAASRWSTSTRPSRTGEQTWAGSGAVMGLILDNHDVSRFSTVAARRRRRRSRGRPRRSRRDPDVYAREQLALGALFALPGAPILYYGDEVGLAGKARPRLAPGHAGRQRARRCCRRRRAPSCETLGQRARVLRRRCAAGRTGRCTSIRSGSSSRGRRPAGETAIVDLQRTPAAPCPRRSRESRPGPWVDVLSGRVQSLSPELTTLPAAPFSVALYVPASSPCAPGAESMTSKRPPCAPSRPRSRPLAAPSAAARAGTTRSHHVNYGDPPDASHVRPRQRRQRRPTAATRATRRSTSIPEAGPPMCPDALKLCAETFTYPYNGETSVELRGDYRAGAWTMGDADDPRGQRVDGDRRASRGTSPSSTSSSSTARRGRPTPRSRRRPTTRAT